MNHKRQTPEERPCRVFVVQAEQAERLEQAAAWARGLRQVAPSPAPMLSPAPTVPLAELRRVDKTYRDASGRTHPVLRDINLAVAPGEGEEVADLFVQCLSDPRGSVHSRACAADLDVAERVRCELCCSRQ